MFGSCLRSPLEGNKPQHNAAAGAEARFPFVVWLDHGHHISKQRKRRFKNPKRWNPPVALLHRIRLSRITPTDYSRDPYIAAVLIALAQTQRQWVSQHGDGHADISRGVFTVRHLPIPLPFQQILF